MNDDSAQIDEALDEFLTQAGLAHHISAFRNARIDMRIARRLREEDMVELNLPIGDRYRFFDALRETAAAETSSAPPRQSQVEARRLQVTALFADIVGSTRLLHSLDPEDYRELLRLYRDLLNRILASWKGTILNFVGDGLVACFGYPRAYENDVRRAIAAALEIVENVPSIIVPGTNEPLAVRVGVATGTCVVGDLETYGTSERDTFVGDAMNLAARLQSEAGPLDVVVCPVTHDVAGHDFRMDALDRVRLKGFAEPVPCWRVLGPATVGAELGDRVIGHEEVTDRLSRAWARARCGALQSATVSGQPGVGKTRLITDLRETVIGEGGSCVVWRGSPLFSNTALHAVTEWLRAELGLEFGAPSLESARRLEAIEIEDSVADAETRSALLTELVSGMLQATDGIRISAQDRRMLMLDALVSHLRLRSRAKPLLIVLEDAHWIDPTTLELAAQIRRDLRDRPIFVLSSRRDGEAENGDAADETIHVPCLEADAAAGLVRQTAGATELSDETVRQIVDRAEGVPLYLIEITRLMANARRATGQSLVIPATLRAALAARLDALGQDRDVALLSSVLGRTFEPELLARLTGRSSRDMSNALWRLVEAQILERAVVGQLETYRFTHALLRDAAYDSLLKRDQVRLHRSVIEIISRLQPALAESNPEILAFHHSNARDHAAAARCWYEAGENALRKSAHSEAMSHIVSGLTEIEKVQSSPESRSLQMKLHSARGRTLISLEGHGSQDVYDALKRAEALAGEDAASAELFPVIWGLNAFHMIRGEVDANDRVSARLVEIAEAGAEHEQRIVAYTSRCLALYYAGRFRELLAHLRKMEAIYDEQTDPALAYKYAVDRLVVGLQHGAWLLWLLGRADEAAAMERRVHAHVHAHPHPYSFAQALTSGASIYVLRREPELMLERARAGVEFARTLGKPVWVDHADIWIGWALSEMGDPEGGGELMKKATDRYAAHRTRSSLPKFYAMLAENRLSLAHLEEASFCIRTAFEQIESLGEQCYAAECRRIEAAIALRAGAAPAQAREMLEAALSLARAQGAFGWEVRIIRDLGTLLLESGDRHTANALLADVLSRATQGRDTPDFRDVEALADAAA